MSALPTPPACRHCSGSGVARVAQDITGLVELSCDECSGRGADACYEATCNARGAVYVDGEPVCEAHAVEVAERWAAIEHAEAVEDAYDGVGPLRGHDTRRHGSDVLLDCPACEVLLSRWLGEVRNAARRLARFNAIRVAAGLQPLAA